jgi:hypothetical protein
VCSLEEQLDQVRQLYILCCWGKALDSFWRFWFDPQSLSGHRQRYCYTYCRYCYTYCRAKIQVKWQWDL